MDSLTHLALAQSLARERERDLQVTLGQHVARGQRGAAGRPRRRLLARWGTAYRAGRPTPAAVGLRK